MLLALIPDSCPRTSINISLHIACVNIKRTRVHSVRSDYSTADASHVSYTVYQVTPIIYIDILDLEGARLEVSAIILNHGKQHAAKQL